MKNIKFSILLIFGLIIWGCDKKDLPQKSTELKPGYDGSKISIQSLGNDPITPYINSTPLLLSTISTTTSGGLITKKITFSSKGGVNIVFAYLIYPAAAGVYPAILVSHGGGGSAQASIPAMQYFANHGYVTMGIDIPSIGDPKLCSESSGPWKSDPPHSDAPKFNVIGGAPNSRLCDALAASLEAFNYLKSLPNVNPNQMGLYGGSWGGYVTTMLSGILGNQIKAAYSTFGCGYYDAGSYWKSIINSLSQPDQATWLSYYDAGRRAQNVVAPYFIEEPSNDWAFWPEAVANTLKAIPGTKNLVIVAGKSHEYPPSSQTMRGIWFDYFLKNTGSPFGSINVASALPQSDGSLQVNLTTNLPSGITASNVKLYYSVPDTNWQSRHWDSLVTVNVSANNYRATLSALLASKNVNYYATVIDNRNVSTSTAIQPNLLPAFPSGTYQIVNRNSGLVLDVKGGVSNNEATIQQYTYHSATNQQWQVTSIGGGLYKIIGLRSGKSIDVDQQHTADGTGVHLYDYKGTNNQKWIITPTTGNYYTIKGFQSNKLLEIIGSANNDGALVDIMTDHNSNNQQWSFQKP